MIFAHCPRQPETLKVVRPVQFSRVAPQHADAATTFARATSAVPIVYCACSIGSVIEKRLASCRNGSIPSQNRQINLKTGLTHSKGDGL